MSNYVPRLKKIYTETITPERTKEFGYTTVMQVPKLVKIVLSMGVGEALTNKKLLDAAVTDLGIITGQKAVKTKAKKSIANFKLREGHEIGAMVTLRGANPNGFDGRGNYSLGVTEQIIFPEIDFDKIEKIAGLNINVVTTAKTDKEARALLLKFGMPFRK